jgi:hypothetical protein
MYAHEIITRITNRLKEHVSSVEIVPCAKAPDDYRLRHPRGALLVHYPRSENDRGRRSRFAVRAVARFEGDALLFLEAARLILNGWQIPGCSRFVFSGDEFVDEKQGVWAYDIAFTISTPAAPVAGDAITNKLTALTAGLWVLDFTTQTFRILDENGNELTDELGDHLTWQ